MKEIRYYLIAAILLLCACDSIMGDCDDPPKFSATPVVFQKGESSKILKAENRVSWSFYSFEMDGKVIDVTYRNRDGQLVDSQRRLHATEVQGSWFLLKKIDDSTIEVRITDSSVAQTLSFLIFDGACFQDITVRNQP